MLTVRDVFSSVPGVMVSNRFNLSQGDRIVMRGMGSRAQFGVRGIKILLDDIPLTFPDGQTQLNNLNTGTLGRIEILRGPSSALYGNSSGGIISIKSDIITDKKFQIKSEINAGSFGFSRYGLGVSGEFINGTAGIDFYTANYGGFRNHSNAKFSGINFITSQRFDERFGFTIIANYYNAPILLNPGSLNKFDSATNPEMVRESIISSGAGKNVKQFQTGISFNYDFSNSSNLHTTLYAINRSLLNAIPSRIIDLQRFSYGVRATFTYSSSALNNINLIAGFDYELQDDSRSEFENMGISERSSMEADEVLKNLSYGEKLLDQQEIVNAFGAFSQIEFLPSENIKLSAGLRYDNFKFEAKDKFFTDNDDNSGSSVMNNFSPTFGVGIRLSDLATLYGNFSTAFQTPTTTELSNTPDASGGFNDSLNPERIKSLETGLRGYFSSLGLNYNVVLFYMNIGDLLIPYQNELEETFYRNSGQTENKGIELSLGWNPYEYALVNLAYTYQDMKFEDFIVEKNRVLYQLADNYVPGIPQHHLNLGFRFRLLHSLFAQLEIRYVSKVYTNDFNGPSPGESAAIDEFINDEYTVVGLMFSYLTDFNFGQLNIKAGVENLFNKRYNGSVVPNAFGNNFFEPASGTALYAGVQLFIN
jgi:iron complex outermembrane receptor protein